MSGALYKGGDLAQAVTDAESALKIREELQDHGVYKMRQKLAEWKSLNCESMLQSQSAASSV